MNEECILCNPAPDSLVYKGDDGVVLVDGPCRPGHVLVGIRGHVADLHEAPPDEVGRMMRLAIRTSKQLVALTGAQKTYVVAIGDKDRHFHVHLIPKMAENPSLGPSVFGEGGWASFLPSAVDEDELRRVVAELRRSLKGD